MPILDVRVGHIISDSEYTDTGTFLGVVKRIRPDSEKPGVVSVHLHPNGPALTLLDTEAVTFHGYISKQALVLLTHAQ